MVLGVGGVNFGAKPNQNPSAMRNKSKDKGRGETRFRIYDCTFQMIKRMSLEEQGRLLEHICRYVEEEAHRDKSGETSLEGLTCEEEDNIGVRIIFDEWKDYYDHDEEERKRVCRKRSAAGQKGMQRRWHPTKTNDNDVTAEDNNVTDEYNTVIADDNTVITENNNVITDNNNVTTDDNNVTADDNIVMENITGVITAIRKKSNQKKENKNLKKETSPYGESKKKISLSLSRTPEERMQEFYESMVPYASQYDREMLNDFYQYWTELDKRRRRMRFEMQKTWEIGKRLALWSRKSFR